MIASAPAAPPERSRTAAWSVAACALLLGCAGLIGIDDARCDPSYDLDCDPQQVESLGLGPNGGAANAAGSNSGAGNSGAGNSGAGDPPLGAGGADSSGEDGPEEPEPDVDLCTRYCETVMANCTGDFTVYASEVSCRNVCGLLEPGEPGDQGVNSVQCRLERAELAAITGEPLDYCFAAGPGGGDACGSDCQAYCSLMESACSADVTSREDCIADCAAVPVAPSPFNVTIGDFGNSIQCRLFHVSAATADPVVHCEHAAGRAVCVGPPPTP